MLYMNLSNENGKKAGTYLQQANILTLASSVFLYTFQFTPKQLKNSSNNLEITMG